MTINDLPENVVGGEPARLIPVAADSNKEIKATSVVLAGLMSVSEFAQCMLSMVGAPSTKRTKVTCFTEVVFKCGPDKEKLRPDGLVEARVGSRVWRALIETKVGNSELGVDQIEGYLDLAKRQGIDAVITISNQFAALPTHHPVRVNGQKLRSVSLFHWSWTAIISQAVLLADHSGVSDPEQAYILKEIIRFLNNDKSGVLANVRMGSEWKAICSDVKNHGALTVSSQVIDQGVSSWLQVSRYLSLEMSKATGVNVEEALSRAHRNDPQRRFADVRQGFTSELKLYSELEIPHAASNLYVRVDLTRRVLEVAMWMKAPQDKKRSSACVTWLLRQLDGIEDEHLQIMAMYAGRRANTYASLNQIRENPKVLLQDDAATLPKYFEIKRVSDNVVRFAGVNTFVEEAVTLTKAFYRDVGENLVAWVPTAPKIQDVVGLKVEPSGADNVNALDDTDMNETQQPAQDPRKRFLSNLIERLPLQ